MVKPSSVLKFVRDPIHDIIRVQDQFILDLLDSTPVQRLRRIRQLGVASHVYPGAEHSRFAHSLGVFHLASRMIEQLDQASGPGLFDQGKREAVLAAALLHDVGHGPFSHVFERVARKMNLPGMADHEKWTVRIIREQEEIQRVLSSFVPDLTSQICQVIDHTYIPHYVTAIVSSQLDADRGDYLLRDSSMTGTRYGSFDLEWMLRTLAVADVPATDVSGVRSGATLQTVVVDGRRGLSGLEAHLIGRHYMYRHVYFHKTIRAAEAMLTALLERAARLIRDGSLVLNSPAFVKISRGVTLSVDEFLGLNDFVVMAWIDEWARSAGDNVLRDLSLGLLNRRLFKTIVVPPTASRPKYAENWSRVRELAQQKYGSDSAFYLLEDTVEDIAYKGYLYNLTRGKVADFEEIWFVDQNGSPQMLSAHSNVLTQASDALRFHEDRWFVSEELKADADAVLVWN